MKEGLFLALVVAFSVAIGAIANELGCDASEIDITPEGPTDPEGFSFLDTFGYIFDAVSSFTKIITYNNPCVNEFVSTLMIGTIGLTSLWTILRLIRGGG